MKRIFETGVYILVLLIGFGFVFAYGRKYWIDHRTYVHSGDYIKNVPGTPWASQSRTLLIILKVGCEFCEGEMPFYRQLQALNDQHQTSAYITTIFPDNAETAKKALEIYDLKAPFIAGVSLANLRVPGTPELILVDREGKVMQVWVGALSSRQHQEVLREVKNSA